MGKNHIMSLFEYNQGTYRKSISRKLHSRTFKMKSASKKGHSVLNITYRVRANSEKIRTIFERICIVLCRFMRNSHNANMVECENGFRLQKCCPCRTRRMALDTHGYFITCRYVPPLSLLPYGMCVYKFYSYILNQKPIMDAFFTLIYASFT